MSALGHHILILVLSETGGLRKVSKNALSSPVETVLAVLDALLHPQEMQMRKQDNRKKESFCFFKKEYIFLFAFPGTVFLQVPKVRCSDVGFRHTQPDLQAMTIPDVLVSLRFGCFEILISILILLLFFLYRYKHKNEIKSKIKHEKRPCALKSHIHVRNDLRFTGHTIYRVPSKF